MLTIIYKVIAKHWS